MDKAKAVVYGLWLLLLLSNICADAAEDKSFKKYFAKYANEEKHLQTCNLPQELVDEIAGYRTIAEQIIAELVDGPSSGLAYKELHDLVDVYPIRLSGTQNLEDAIDYMMTRMEAYGLENVRGEQVLVGHWVRGEESAQMLEPHTKNLRILGLGSTVGTPEEGLNAQVLVVKNFTELDARQAEAAGKIVVFNQGWLGTYEATNAYRTDGADYASQYGAIATLIESVGDFSMDSPHTGQQYYTKDVPHIPTACITKEDAAFMYRLQQRGETIRIHLKMLDYNLPVTTSRNVIGEIGGAGIPDELVLVSGHIDSWDLGQGCMDDGGGVMVSMMALAVLKKLDLIPKRKLQAILWTSEENGLWGVKDFALQHSDILANYSVVMESDHGTFKPVGLDFAGSEEAGCILQEVLKLTDSIGASTYAKYPTVSSDITELIAKGVPGISMNTENERYFWYHHTDADTITMMNTTHLDMDTALWAVSSYVLADISVKLPRD